ncbi:MAG: DUF1508 domain-containing protein [Pseudomonadota bacterium]
MLRVFRDNQNFWRWRMKTQNGRTIADSGEGYHNKQDCLHAIDLVRRSGSAGIG